MCFVPPPSCLCESRMLLFRPMQAEGSSGRLCMFFQSITKFLPFLQPVTKLGRIIRKSFIHSIDLTWTAHFYRLLRSFVLKLNSRFHFDMRRIVWLSRKKQQKKKLANKHGSMCMFTAVLLISISQPESLNMCFHASLEKIGTTHLSEWKFDPNECDRIRIFRLVYMKHFYFDKGLNLSTCVHVKQNKRFILSNQA